MDQAEDFQALLAQIKAMVPESFPTNSWYIIVVGTEIQILPVRTATNYTFPGYKFVSSGQRRFVW